MGFVCGFPNRLIWDSSIFLQQQIIPMHRAICYNPSDYKTCKTCHEAFFDNFPYATVSFFINLLKIDCIEIHVDRVEEAKPEISELSFLLNQKVNVTA